MDTDPMGRLATALANQYRIDRELGGGGMSRVFVAEELALGRQVVIKVIAPELLQGLSAERFAREVRVAARLQQANIVPVLSAGEVEGLPYYTMPFVRGESLRARLAEGKPFAVAEALSILRDVARALAAAHAEGIVHRDIKPENILLSGGAAVVTDFGIAKAISTSRTLADGGTALTNLGHSVGTPAYMAPEQAAGDPGTDQRADIYAWGVVAWELLAGKHPFAECATPQALLAAHMSVTPQNVTTARQDVPTALNALIHQTLAKNPADRPATATALLAALDTVQLSEGAPVVPPPASRRPRWIAAAAALAVVAIVTTLARQSRTVDSATPNIIRSIAVLPLDNYSADTTQDYFAEGMTDELTSNLAMISQLQVTSRGSAMQFKGKERPPIPEIARVLNVDAIVEGSVTRSGDRVRITAQLIDARTDKHLWSETFERKSSDVLALQGELAAAIANAINIRLTPSEQSRLAAAPTVDPEAHDAYLKGRFFFNRPSDDNLQKAIVQFNETIALSPDFAPAYSGLSDAYAWAAYNEGFIRARDARPLAKAAAERAVALDSLSAEAHTSLGVFRAWFERDWEGSERALRRAIALNPNYAYAHDQLNQTLVIVGRFDEAIEEGRRAVALDPLSPAILIDLATSVMYAGRSTEALELTRQAAELDPTFFFPPTTEGLNALQHGDHRVAIARFEKARALGAPPFVTAYLAYVHGASGNRGAAMAALRELEQMSSNGGVVPFNLALVHLGLGDHQRTIDYLEQAYASSSLLTVWLKVDKIYDPLRSEPRFIALTRKLRFVP